MRPIAHHRRLPTALAVLTLLALTGCGGGSHTSSSSAALGAANAGGAAVNGNLSAKAPQAATAN
ncbi:MAG TPA: hypothetical protein VH298_03055, partial [Jatrophihabitans sp.]|nr:hypothetical protein [Jatrophihabitans sp.]